MKAISYIFSTEYGYDYWFKKNWYYHAACKALYSFIIPSQMRVVQVGCKNGALLNAVQPSYGVGIDENKENICHASQNYPHLNFIHGGVQALTHEQPFDYVILSSTVMEVADIQQLFESLQPLCHEKTRLVMDVYSTFWEPILWLAQKLKLRRPTLIKNWVSQRDIATFLSLANFETITHGRHFLIPVYIPLISWFFNTLVASLPLINLLCLIRWTISRPVPKKELTNYSVSIVIPCKNERGNVQAAVERCPVMGSSTEIIFVEGGSRDGTLEEIQRVCKEYSTPEKKVSYYIQKQKGKGEAIRLAFKQASGDILMIQDGDLTAPPEELPKFYAALATGKGDFINGSRLVYGMEDKAMRFLNLCANYLFGIGFSWLLGQPIKDTLCGTKVLFKKDYEQIKKHRAFFGDFDPFGDFDLLFGAAKQNLKIIEVPVHYKNRTYGTTNISRFRNGITLLYMSWIAFKRFKYLAIKR